MARSAKLLILAVEAGLTFAVWWSIQPEHEQQLMRAGAWKLLQKASGRAALKLGILCLKAEEKYFEEVRA